MPSRQSVFFLVSTGWVGKWILKRPFFMMKSIQYNIRLVFSIFVKWWNFSIRNTHTHRTPFKHTSRKRNGPIYTKYDSIHTLHPCWSISFMIVLLFQEEKNISNKIWIWCLSWWFVCGNNNCLAGNGCHKMLIKDLLIIKEKEWSIFSFLDLFYLIFHFNFNFNSNLCWYEFCWLWVCVCVFFHWFLK